MGISEQIFDAAVAPRQRSVFLESQIAELGVLRSRLAQAQLRRPRLRPGRSPSNRLGRRRRCR